MSGSVPLNSARRALDFLNDGDVVGLGSGRAAAAFVEALGERVRDGLRVTGVPTSEATAYQAQRLGIPLTDLNRVESIDLAVDGADEVDPRSNLIKGLGGALVREKIVASATRRLIILVGPDKLVSVLGARGMLPVEVIPFALGPCRRQIEAMGLSASLREDGGRPFVTDNGNHILTCRIAPIDEPAALETALRAIPGVVGTGLFLGMAPTVLVDEPGGVRLIEPPGPSNREPRLNQSTTPG